MANRDASDVLAARADGLATARTWLRSLGPEGQAHIAEALAERRASAAEEPVPTVLTVRAAAVALSCSERTVRRRIANGSLLAVRDPGGRLMIRADDLRLHVESFPAVRPASPEPRRTAPRAKSYGFLRETR